MNGLTYAVGDIHGRHDLLIAALDVIEADAGDLQAKIVCLGDYIDRGPSSRAVIETLMAGPRRIGDEMVCLKGNHEDIAVQAHRDPAKLGWWVGNGGGEALASYGGEVPGDHIKWMDGLPVTHDDGVRLFVHAGLMPGLALEDQPDEACLWIRDRFLSAPAEFPRHIVHGHTPGDNPELLPHRTNLDVGACWTGRLAIGVFAPDEPEPLAVLYAGGTQ